MPIFTDPFAVLAPYNARFRHAPSRWATPPARAERSVADDAEHVRSERRIDAADTNRPDYDAVPEHDPDGTPWAA